jgi:oxygen-independent coproporphyrinogen-3 oxidase
LKKCPYCDFNSHVPPSETAPPSGALALPEARYLDALCADLEASLPLIWGRRVVSVFVGGGTPSLFSSEGIERLLGDVRARLPLEPGCEITLEANPGTFEAQRFRAFRRAGVTRLSIGVQSFDDEALRQLGRVHDAAQARAAVAEAREAFDTFNIDLMYALPGQDLAGLDADLSEALALKPPLLSINHLTIEPNTYIAKFPPTVPEDDLAYDMLDHLVARASQTGLARYEVSAFAQAGHRCWHNLNYWRFGDYLGIGAGAHSKLSFAHRVVRQVRVREPRLYMERAAQGQAIAQEQEVSRADLPFEFMLNALRLPEGFALQDFTDRTGLPPSVLQEAIAKAQSSGLLHADPTHIRPTERGFDFLNDLQALFLPPSSRP